jgi:hypothetical protein
MFLVQTPRAPGGAILATPPVPPLAAPTSKRSSPRYGRAM